MKIACSYPRIVCPIVRPIIDSMRRDPDHFASRSFLPKTILAEPPRCNQRGNRDRIPPRISWLRNELHGVQIGVFQLESNSNRFSGQRTDVGILFPVHGARQNVGV